MKTYLVCTYVSGEFVQIAVNVPTPKELQASTKNDEFSVVISNFSSAGGEPDFAVASFEKETDEVLIKMGFLFKVTARTVERFQGRNARQNAVEAARDILVGRF